MYAQLKHLIVYNLIFKVLFQLTNRNPPNRGLLPRVTSQISFFSLEANNFKNIAEKYLKTRPYPYPESDIYEEVYDIYKPVPTVDQNMHSSTHRNFIW